MTIIALQKFKIKVFSIANPDGVAGGIAIFNGMVKLTMYHVLFCM